MQVLQCTIATGRPVAGEVGRAVVNSLILASAATLIGFTLGTLFGFVAGYHRNSLADRAASALSVFLFVIVAAGSLLYVRALGKDALK